MGWGLVILVIVLGLQSGKSVTGTALAEQAKVVSLSYDGRTQVLTTDAVTVGELLQRAAVHLGPGDIVEPPLSTKLPKGQFNVNIYRSRPVVVVDGAQTYRVNTAYTSPRLMAQAAGLTVYPEDMYTTNMVTNFVGDQSVGVQVRVIRAKPVTVTADGRTRNFRTQAATVGELLAEMGINLGPKDTIAPAPAAAVLPGMHITIVRVAEVQTTVTETLARSVKTVTDPNLAKGMSQIKAAGSDGHRTVTYLIHYRDGVEVQRDTLAVNSLVQPVVQVVLVGTKIFFAGSVEYWRPLVQTAAISNGLDPNLMLAVMTCESNGNATANNGSHFGLFQYDWPTWLGAGGTRDNVFDGAAQITITAWKMARYGTKAWAASQHCWGPIVN